VKAREQRPDHAEADQRHDHSPPQDEQRAGRGAEHGELPPRAERSSEWDRGSEDRADCRGACTVQE
jgi:hypothetical protein